MLNCSETEVQRHHKQVPVPLVPNLTCCLIKPCIDMSCTSKQTPHTYCNLKLRPVSLSTFTG